MIVKPGGQQQNGLNNNTTQMAPHQNLAQGGQQQKTLQDMIAMQQ